MKPSLRLSRKHFAIPYALFLSLFVAVPLFFIIIFAFTDESGNFSILNFGQLFTGGTSAVLLKSMLIGLITTAICILIGYPIAYIMSQKKFFKSSTLIYLFVLPMWINFLLRTLATKLMFEYIHVNMGYFTVIFGMVYDFLPFMILPIYTTLSNMDKSLIEAAQDLGASDRRVFWRVTMPMSLPGIISGILMVFMPSLSTLAISDILSNNKIKLFGNFIDLWIRQNNWNIGSAMSLILLLFIALSMFLNNKFSGGRSVKGGGLW